MADQRRLARVHYELIKALKERSSCPSVDAMAQTIGTSPEDAENLLVELESIHGVVLHPHARIPWIVHPFSLTPTIHWIKGETGSWWAPCVWCAFGVAVLVGGPTQIYTRYAAEAEPLVLEVIDGRPLRDDIVVHFAIPPARAWDNVHQHCSLVLPFRSPREIQDWCQRYEVPMGEAVPLATVSELARAWYGTHADQSWRKWTIQEAAGIFSRVGLTSNFWRLQNGPGHF